MSDLSLARRSLAAFAELIGWPMALFQVAALTLETRVTAIVANRQTGKSRSLALLAVHRAFANPGSQILIVSAGDEAAKRLLAEVRNIINGVDFLRGSVVDEHMSLVGLTNGSAIRSVPASERQIRGWSIDLLLIDEAALVSDDLILGAAFPTTAARPDAKIVLASSASAASGAFFDHVMLGRQGSEHIRTFTWSLTDCPWISPSVIEAARESMTPTRFEAEYEGKFASGADALFPRALLDRATAAYEMPGLHGLSQQCRVGGHRLGCHHRPDDLRRGQPPTGPCGPLRGHLCARMAERLPGRRARRDHRRDHGDPGTFDQVSMETNGVGYPLAREAQRRLEERRRGGLRVELVTTTQASKAATYGQIRMALEQGRLILPAAATELLRELLLLRVQITQGGGEKIEAGFGHDDLADGLYPACGPYNTPEGWRSRLGDAISGDLPPSDVELEGDVVETGAGLLVPRQPTFLTACGARYGPASTAPSPWSSGYRRPASRRSSGPPISTASQRRGEDQRAAARKAREAEAKKARWFEGMNGAQILDRIRVTKRRDTK